MKTPSTLVVLGVVASLSLNSAVASPAALHAFTADYQANYMGMQANGTMTLTAASNHQWDYTFVIQNQLATLKQSTHFEEHAAQLRPLSSNDLSALLVKRREVKTQYNWDTHQATWSGDIKPNRRGPIQLQEGDMDGLLLNLAIVRDVAANRPLNYRMVDEGRVKNLQYTVQGKETLMVNGKQTQATKVAEHDGSKEIIAWVVADVPVPVRLLQRTNGQDTLELTLSAFH